MKNVKLVAIVSAVALGVSACSQGSAPEPGPEMGNATPQASPQEATPDGEVFDFAEVSDMDQTGDLLGLRTPTGLTIGTIDEITSGTAREIPLGDECTDVSANDGAFVVACGTEVRIIRGTDETTVTTEEPVKTATVMASGEVVAASGEKNHVWLYKDGELIDDFPVQDPTDEIIAVPRAGGARDAVVRINRMNTTIQDLDLENSRGGGTLRVGLGIGQAVPGTDGLVVVSDAMGPQIAIYTADDVIRLHQTAPVDDSPWGAAWDEKNALAWIASTGTNTATGFDISTGVPLEKTRLNTIPDVHDMAVLADGTAVFTSASGAGIQVVPAADITIEG